MFRAAVLHYRRFAQTAAPGSQGSDLHRDSDWSGAWKEASQSFRAALFVRSEPYFGGSSHVASQLAAVLPYYGSRARLAHLFPRVDTTSQR